MTSQRALAGEYVFVATDPRGRVAELLSHFIVTIHEIGELPFGADDFAAVRALVSSIVELVPRGDRDGTPGAPQRGR